MKVAQKAVLFGAIPFLVGILILREATRTKAENEAPARSSKVTKTETPTSSTLDAEKNENHVREDRKQTVESAQKKAPAVAKAQNKVRTAPKDVEEDALRLKEWLLALPTADFRLLIRTPTMDRYVVQIMDHLMTHATGGQEPEKEVELFLTRLNTRIEKEGSPQ